MFTIMGSDGKEYGPVSAEQTRAWLAGGRANLDTKAKAAGSDEWRRLGDFPEFSGTGSLPPPPLAAGVARAAPLSIGGCLERGWNLLKSDFWSIVGTTFVLCIVGGVAGAIPILGLLVSLLLTGVFYGGLYFFYLKKIRGQTAEISDAFSGFSLALGPLMIASLLVSLLTIVGFVCLILPGIYLAISYLFAYLLVIDRKLEFWAAMEVSRRVNTDQWWRASGLAILGGIIAVLGVLGLVIGFFVTLPIFIGALVYAYEDLCNPPPRA
ncbi:MAG: GYF domain-containing protein [Opitutales bacterium]|nr:GYF domain-containing protein [Opitutales bacterium]